MGAGASTRGSFMTNGTGSFVAMGAGGLVTERDLQKIIQDDNDYQSIKKKAFEFSLAHRAIQRTIHRKQSNSALNNMRSASRDTGMDAVEKKRNKKIHGTEADDHHYKDRDKKSKPHQHSNKKIISSTSVKAEMVSIELLSMRQLSFTLSNQAVLNRSKAHIMRRSTSLPKIVNKRIKENVILETDQPSPAINVPLSPLSYPIESPFSANRVEFKEDLTRVDEKSEVFSDSALPAVVAEPKKPVKRPKPSLSLQLTLSGSDSEPIIQNDQSTSSHNNSFHSKQSSQQQQLQQMHNPNSSAPLHSAGSISNIRLSPHGTLHMGKLKIMENGIFSAEDIAMSASNSFSLGGSSEKVVSSSNDEKNGEIKSTQSHNHSKRVQRISDPISASFRGKDDFIEIGTLGSGASGVVSEAIHLPTLTIVALKMLPVYNQEKRQHVSRELSVLYKNLSVLQLVDDSLSTKTTSTDGKQRSKDEKDSSSKHKCDNILSLYNAFVDPKSGMINLVIEYMDGGSLEDLVKQGGCRDEQVLADIAYQTAKGLCFLHGNNNVHRDIKPANILCSSSGVIKIADFGISRALDKASAFTNSFVGTVCYMSPERITGENYSFPCDIWSLGLTLLAVSLGRFPLLTTRKGDLNGESTSQKADKVVEIGGGAGGYWAMIKAICDDPPPTPDASFSEEFHEFIAFCLCRDPTERLTAEKLLSTDFLRINLDPDSLSASDKIRHKKLADTIASSSDTIDRDKDFDVSDAYKDDSSTYNTPQRSKHNFSESLDEKTEESDTPKSLHMLHFPSTASRITPDLLHVITSATHKTPDPSPARRGSITNHSFSARSATAAVVCKEISSPGGVRKSENFPTPVANRGDESDVSTGLHIERTIKSLILGMGASSTRSSIFGINSHSSSVTEKENSSPAQSGVGIADVLPSIDANEELDEHEVYIMNSIRLEHFDRVLEKIATKVFAKKKSSAMKQISEKLPTSRNSDNRSFGKKSQSSRSSAEDSFSMMSGSEDDVEEFDVDDEEFGGIEGGFQEEEEELDGDDGGDDADTVADKGMVHHGGSIDERDLMCVHSYSTGDDSVGEFREIIMVNSDTNIDSEMDRLLQYKENQPPQRSKQQTAAVNPIELLRNTNASSQHSILKTGGSFMSNANAHTESHHPPSFHTFDEISATVSAIVEQLNNSSHSSSLSGKHRHMHLSSEADEKASLTGSFSQKQQPLLLSSSSFSSKTSSSVSSTGTATVATGNNNNGLNGQVSNSSRSVHFMDAEHNSFSMRSTASNSSAGKEQQRAMLATPTKPPPPSGGGMRGRSNMMALQLDLFEGDDELDHNNNSFHNTDEGPSDADHHSDPAAIAKHRFRTSGSPSAALAAAALAASKSTATTSQVDYLEMLPKLDEKGLRKWKKLAEQLKLPFHLVMIAVKARFGDIVSVENHVHEV